MQHQTVLEYSRYRYLKVALLVVAASTVAIVVAFVAAALADGRWWWWWVWWWRMAVEVLAVGGNPADGA
jgi:hypothetical protein